MDEHDQTLNVPVIDSATGEPQHGGGEDAAAQHGRARQPTHERDWERPRPRLDTMAINAKSVENTEKQDSNSETLLTAQEVLLQDLKTVF